MSVKASIEKKTSTPSKRPRPAMEGPTNMFAAMGRMSLGGRGTGSPGAQSPVCSECSKNCDTALVRS
jgi:hypothetical protein